MTSSPVAPLPIIPATEKVALLGCLALRPWMVSEVLPETITKMGLVDAWLPSSVWPESKPPPGMRVSATRPG